MMTGDINPKHIINLNGIFHETNQPASLGATPVDVPGRSLMFPLTQDTMRQAVKSLVQAKADARRPGEFTESRGWFGEERRGGFQLVMGRTSKAAWLL